MKIRIKSIKVEGFKCFQSFSRNFYSENIIIFDGPNGFGKTSFYDAIEFLFTGQVRRYEELVTSIVDKRSNSQDGSPLLNKDYDGESLSIKAELEVNGDTVFLMRKESAATLRSQQKISSTKLPLYRLESFEDNNPQREENETEYLQGFFGKDYIENFEYLNYIEQQENIYLLKQPDKGRATAIAHLFKTSEFQNKIQLIADAKKKLKKLCDADKKRQLESQKQDIDEQEKRFNESELNQEDYTRLINWKEVVWDKKQIDVPISSFVEWLDDDGELDGLLQLVSHQKEYKKERENKKIRTLLDNEPLLKQYIQYWKYIEKEPSLSRALSLQDEITGFLKSYENGVVSHIEKDPFVLSENLKSILQQTELIDYTSYTPSLEHIKSVQSRTNSFSVMLSKIQSTRQNFIDKFLKHSTELAHEGACPLCGYSWEDLEKLKKEFKEQEKHFQALIEKEGAELSRAVEAFEKQILVPLKMFLTEYKSQHKIDKEFVLKLQKAVKNQEHLHKLSQALAARNINALEYAKEANIEHDELGINALLEEISSQIKAVDYEKIQSNYDALFIEIFEKSFDKLSSISVNDIKNKIIFIKSQFSLKRSEDIQKKRKEYTHSEKLFKRAKNTHLKLSDLEKIYKKSLSDYQSSFIENIEILFHIYYGRIAQETKNSLGLFIQSDGSAIKFLEHHSRDTDAIFTMSAGQLATLVIAFTLALNKRFSENKLLFIDDPIQTLDELNIAGLVELLRNEFDDQQIFLSTHEDSMSTYIRYKFKKFGLQHERLSFKEAQLKAI